MYLSAGNLRAPDSIAAKGSESEQGRQFRQSLQARNRPVSVVAIAGSSDPHASDVGCRQPYRCRPVRMASKTEIELRTRSNAGICLQRPFCAQGWHLRQPHLVLSSTLYWNTSARSETVEHPINLLPHKILGYSTAWSRAHLLLDTATGLWLPSTVTRNRCQLWGSPEIRFPMPIQRGGPLP